MLAMTESKGEDPLEPLWKKAHEAADKGDMPGVLFVWKALAEKGVWQIYARIGWLYEDGAEGIEKNAEQAMYWYRKAVFEGDDPLGHVGLGRAHYDGSGVSQDYSLAFHHFQKAYAQGLPEAGIYLGIMYHAGLGTVRDMGRAEACYRLAASADYYYAYIKLARLAFDQKKFIAGFKFWVKGILLGLRLARSNTADPRLLGIASPQNRR